MILYDLPRQSGKTTMLLQRLEHDPKAVLLVPSYVQARWLGSARPHLAGRIWTIQQALAHHNKRGCGEQTPHVFLIDEIDMCLATILGGKVLAATTSSLEFA